LVSTLRSHEHQHQQQRRETGRNENEMKATINGLRYDSARCEPLAEQRHYSNGNYSGTSTLLYASDGAFLIHTYSNGQDCYLRDSLVNADTANVTPHEFLEECDLDDAQERRLVELGILRMVD